MAGIAVLKSWRLDVCEQHEVSFGIPELLLGGIRLTYSMDETDRDIYKRKVFRSA